MAQVRAEFIASIDNIMPAKSVDEMNRQIFEEAVISHYEEAWVYNGVVLDELFHETNWNMLKLRLYTSTLTTVFCPLLEFYCQTVNWTQDRELARINVELYNLAL